MSLKGEMFGQYQLIEAIGAGGMATVYKAYQPGLDRYVAIKVLPAQHALTPGFKQRFIREAKAVAQLSHPNILPIYDVGLEGDLSYFVMKYVPGHTLQDLLGKPLDLPNVNNFINQVASALDHAHKVGIVHRDIKPTNMLLENDWLLLTDFGLAKILMTNQDLTDKGLVIGTPAYLAPEQAEGHTIDHRADIYSLGVVLYEMVTGQVPYKATSPMGILLKHIQEPVPRPCLISPNLPTEIETIILKAMAKNPANRYNEAGELAKALQDQLYPTSAKLPKTSKPKPARLFICYKRNTDPSQQLATYLHTFLAQQGQHQVFIDSTLRTGTEWLEEIDEQIKASDFFVVLLSKESANSEMVQAEVRRAYEYRKLQGYPQTLPVRVAYEGLLPYSIDAFLDPLQYLTWQSEADNEDLGNKILGAIANHQLPRQNPISVSSINGSSLLSEDGSILPDEEKLHPPPPLPEFDPRFLDILETPGGVVKPRDKFYIQREADAQLWQEITKPGTTTTIRASRQTGKTSLLVRGVNHARQIGAKIVNLDLQRIDSDHLIFSNLFLRDLAESIIRKLGLDMKEVENFWQGSLGPQDKLTYLMEDYVLPESDTPIVLALDEVDRLLETNFYKDFFALLRSWHNNRALDEQWDKLNIVMVISTEPYLFVFDVNQSPFNVGLKLYLEDFNEEQVRDLNRRHCSPVLGADFPELMNLLGGHPYLTRKALYTMVVKHLTWIELTQIADRDHGPFGDHLRHHHWLLRNRPDLQEALKQVTEQNDYQDELALFRLLQAGLIRSSDDGYTWRCGLYKSYFEDIL